MRTETAQDGRRLRISKRLFRDYFSGVSELLGSPPKKQSLITVTDFHFAPETQPQVLVKPWLVFPRFENITEQKQTHIILVCVRIGIIGIADFSTRFYGSQTVSFTKGADCFQIVG